MAAEQETRRADLRVANVIKKLGVIGAVVGIIGPESWIVPGVAAAGLGWGYEQAADPEKKPKLKSRGTIFQRAKEIYTGSPTKTKKQYALAA